MTAHTGITCGQWRNSVHTHLVWPFQTVTTGCHRHGTQWPQSHTNTHLMYIDHSLVMSSRNTALTFFFFNQGHFYGAHRKLSQLITQLLCLYCTPQPSKKKKKYFDKLNNSNKTATGILKHFWPYFFLMKSRNGNQQVKQNTFDCLIFKQWN